MKNKRTWVYLIVAVCGTILLLSSKFIVSESSKSFQGMCIGIGAAAFCLGVGNVIGTWATSKTETEEIRKIKSIEVNDERNIRIREKAGAKTNSVLIYILSAAVMALGFMNAGITVIIIVAAVMLLQIVLFIAFSSYYAKKM